MKQQSSERLTVGYTRVSTALQDRDDAYGRASQMRDIVAWSHVSGMAIDRWIHDTISGAILEREGLGEVRELNADGRLGALVIARQDRLARETLSAETLYREIEGMGGKIINVQIQLESSPIGTMMRRILDAFAELERDLIRERTTKGKLEAVRKNATFMHGRVPLGYRWIPKTECKASGLPSGSLAIVEDQADTVRLIFRLRERGHGYNSIAAYLNDHGHRSSRNTRFAATTVQKIIQNEAFYRGERVATKASTLGMSEEEYSLLRPAHPPILPPRLDGEDYLLRRIRETTLRDALIPDDLDSDAPLVRRQRRNIHVLTRSYAAAILMAKGLLDAGATCQEVADALNQAGHKTRQGSHFWPSTVLRIERRLDWLVPLAEQAFARPESEASEEAVATAWSDIVQAIHEMVRGGVSRKRGEMSYAKVATALTERFGQTPNGGKFYSETVIRLLKEHPLTADAVRTVGYVRIAKDGTDHLGQIDVIESWAEKSGLEIAEWYIDRGTAMSDNTLTEFRRLNRDANDARFGRVAVFSLERICRERERARQLLRTLGDRAEVFTVSSEDLKQPKRPPYMPSRPVAQAAA